MNLPLKGYLILLLSLLTSSSIYGQIATPEICNNGIDDDGDFLIDCYDPDCAADPNCNSGWVNVLNPCNPPPVNFTLTAQEKWRTDTSLYDVFSTQTPAVGDIDNDGVVEIIAYDHNGDETSVSTAGPGDTLFIFDGNTGAIEGYCAFSGTGVNAARQNTASIAIGNLDGDPFSEIIVLLDDTRLARFEHTGGAPTWVSLPLSGVIGVSIFPIPNIADLDGDGNAEIYQGPHIWNGQTGAFIGSGGFGIPAIAIGAPVNSAGGTIPYGMSVAVDVLPDQFCSDCAGLEIVCGFQVFSVNIGTGTITPVVTAAPPAGLGAPVDGFTAVADYDHDGDLDGIIAANRQLGGGTPIEVMVYVWDLQTPNVIATSSTYTSPTFGTVGQPTVADFDGDALVEVAIIIEDNIIVFDDHNNSMVQLWSRTSTDGSGFTGTAAFDFSGDGSQEIVYRNEDSLRIFDGGTGQTLYSVLCYGSTVMEKPLVADVDGDDQAEVICACSERPPLSVPPSSPTVATLPRLHGYIAVYESAGDPWAPARDLWNQSSYHVTNVNDDLSIPIQQQQHHIAANGALNGFNLQASSYDTLGNVVFPPCSTLAAPPIAVTDSFQVPKNSGPFPMEVLGNDSGDSLIVTIITPPNNGTATVVSDLVIYEPDSSYFGPDSLQYLVCNGFGCDSAWVLINVFFLDTLPPIANCQNLTLYLNQLGNSSLSALSVDNGSTDDCGINSIAINQTTFNCSDVGTNTVTLTVEDIGGNTASCQSVVTVVDTISPTAVCQSLTLSLDGNGIATTTASAVDVGSSDACGIASLNLSPTTFSCSDIGPNPGTLIVTDVNGNSSFCTTVITVEDNDAPNALCQDITLYLNGSGSATITPGDIDNGSSDNCSIVNSSLDSSSFDCANLGINTVTLTVSDTSGNVGTCTSQVTVEDTIPPIAICQSVTVQLDSSGNYACGNQIALDSAGNLTSGIIANDALINGIIYKGGTEVIFNAAGNVVQGTILNDVLIGGINYLGCTEIVLNAFGNVVRGTLRNDTQIGGITYQAGTVITFNAVGGVLSGTLRNDTVIGGITYQAGTEIEFNLGTVVRGTLRNDTLIGGITYKAGTEIELDGMGNVVRGTLRNDTVIGGITYKADTEIELDGNGNVRRGTLRNDTIIGGITYKACTEIELDAAGNVVRGTLRNDTLIGGITYKACTEIEFNAAGNVVRGTLRNDTIIGGVTYEACTEVRLDGAGNVVRGTLKNDTQIGGITYKAGTEIEYDGAGNVVRGTLKNDTLINGITYKADTEIELDAAGNVVRGTLKNDTLINGITYKACTEIEFNAAGNVVRGTLKNDTLINGITYKACTEIEFNAAGNVIWGTLRNVTLINGLLYADCSVIGFDDFGNVVFGTLINVTNFNGVPYAGGCQLANLVNNGSMDSCGVASISVSPNGFNCDSVGINPVILTVTDVNGNTSTCSAQVTVEDTIAPVALCRDITVVLDSMGNATISGSDLDNGSSDGCGINSLVASMTNFSCADTGSNTVTLSVTDPHGNISACTSHVTVEDTLPPVALCQNLTIQLGPNGNASIISSDVDNGSSDACGLGSISIDSSSFTCANIGGNTVTLTVTDVNGNASSCNALVTVEDTISPSAICQNLTLQLNPSGNASIIPQDIDNGSNDNCAVASISANPLSFSCADIGNNPVILSVTDVNGNSSTCTSQITIEDTLSPLALCTSDTVYLDSSGNASTTPANFDAGSTDNCLIDSSWVVPNTFTQSNLGANLVILTVQDPSGNLDSCSATVFVFDSFPPVNSPPVATNDTFSIPKNSAPQGLPILGNDFDPDNDPLTVSILFPPANGTVIVNGNTVTYEPNTGYVGADSFIYVICDASLCDTATVFIDVFFQDLIPPVALCGTDTLYLDSNGIAILDPLDLDAGSTDDCGIDSIWVGQTTFTVNDLGTNQVSLTVQDLGGNLDTCLGTVVVLDTIGVGVEAGFEAGFAVYPVPTSGYLHIEALQPDILIDAVTVYDLRGKRVLNSHSEGEALVRVDLGTIADGIYWLRIDAGDSAKWQKIQVLRE